MSAKSFSSSALTLEVEDRGEAIYVTWLGKSTARDPAQFILPVLTNALHQSVKEGKPLVLDFQQIEYMNSSTITPIIRVLDQARRGEHAIRVMYRGQLKWQELSFSALEIFETPDKRIEIQAV